MCKLLVAMRKYTYESISKNEIDLASITSAIATKRLAASYILAIDIRDFHIYR